MTMSVPGIAATWLDLFSSAATLCKQLSQDKQKLTDHKKIEKAYEMLSDNMFNITDITSNLCLTI